MEIVACAAAATIATGFSAALLTAPAVLGTMRLLARRLVAPLRRGSIERSLVFCASLAGALGALACAGAMALLLGSYPEERRRISTLLLHFVAPAPLGAVPWVAGEVLSGASLRRWRSLAAAIAASSVASWAAFAALWPHGPGGEFDFWRCGIEAAATGFAGLYAAFTYLAVRGEARDSLPAEALALERT